MGKEAEQEGVVIEVNDDTAKVKTSRHNDCANCGACPGNSAMVLEAYNDLSAKAGQRVVVKIQPDNMLKAAFIVYVLPLVASLLGVIAGTVLAEKLGISAVWFQIGGGCSTFLLSIWYIRYYDYHARTNAKSRPRVIKILK
ncbi:SoxR reducing system RseC family protein [Dendrosporobacter sp. 1207_IL3150]|uniref:SoxR reducing system RseC family protein n=1 Tax=Dendrosporobacter sp. 1207_IL3150 TaxID=3084054 RepID=UPI002FDA06B1